jgi:hypothetical protein
MLRPAIVNPYRVHTGGQQAGFKFPGTMISGGRKPESGKGDYCDPAGGLVPALVTTQVGCRPFFHSAFVLQAVVKEKHYPIYRQLSIAPANAQFWNRSTNGLHLRP